MDSNGEFLVFDHVTKRFGALTAVNDVSFSVGKGEFFYSADPYEWGEKMIAHYKSLGIDTMTKTLLFSDSLDLDRATAINNHFRGKAKVAFGIGTALVGPVSGALNIVIKPVAFDGRPVAKLSDAAGKNMCEDPAYIDYLQRSISWRLEH